MKKSPLDREIRSRIDAFLSGLSSLVKNSALNAVRTALGEAAAPASAPAAPAALARAPKARGRRGKRTPEQVTAMASTILDYVRANPGQRLEQIGAGLGMATKGLKLPVQKLLGDKAIHSQGQRRGTKYFAGSGGGRRKGRGRARKA